VLTSLSVWRCIMKTDLSLLEAMDAALDIIKKQDADEYIAEVAERSNGTFACFLEDLGCTPSEALGQDLVEVEVKKFSEFELSYDKSVSYKSSPAKMASPTLEFSEELIVGAMLGSMASNNNRSVAA